MRGVVATGIAFVLAAALASAAGARARVLVPLALTINPTGSLSSDGFSVTVSGHVVCATAYRYSLVVQLIQPGTGALAAGAFPPPPPSGAKSSAAVTRLSLCKGKVGRSWSTSVPSRGSVPSKLVAGSAKVCVIVRSRLVKPPGTFNDELAVCQSVSLR